MKQRLFCLIITALSISPWVSAQEFTIKKIELTADQLLVHYDLIDTTRYRTYTIRVFSSMDNFLAPLNKVSGDAGIEIQPGLNKKIVWNSKEELSVAFVGDVELEIRGRVYVPFIRLVGFEDIPEQKRKVPFLVKWTGGTTQNVLNFQLYNRYDELVYTPPNAPNELEYQITIPSSVKAGKGYYFKISDSKNADQVVRSPTFNLKPKYPLVVKAIPVVIVGGIIYWVASMLGNKEDFVDGPPDTPPTAN